MKSLFLKDELFFDEPNHIYTNKEGLKYESVTQFLGHFYNHFEDQEQFWLIYKSLQYLSDIDKPVKIKKYNEELDKLIGNVIFTEKEYQQYQRYGLSQCDKDDKLFINVFSYREQKEIERVCKLIKTSWVEGNKKSTRKGSAFHLAKEDKQFKDKLFNFNGKEYPVIPQHSTIDWYNLEPGTHVELKLILPEFRLAGTADQIIITPEKKVICRDWKGFSLDTPIATENGFKLMQDIKENDLVFDGNGDLTKVTHISQIHHNPCYKITFDTNDELICDNEHRWIIKGRNKNNKWYEKEMLTEEIFNYYENNIKLGKLSIPCVKLNIEEKELPIDPYVLGIWLADGNRTCGSITKPNPEIWDEIQKRGYEIGIDHNRNNEKTECRTVLGLHVKLRELNLIGNKHIPDIYFRSSYKQRLDLLRGFMDGDGYYHPKRKRCVFETTNLIQANFIKQLVSTLGFKAILIPYKTSGFGKTDIQAYSICFSPTESPFLRRNTNYLENIKDKNFHVSSIRYIKSIEKIETVPTKCITVESNTHCYLAGHNLIKTHNSNLEIKTSNKYQNMLHCCSHLEDCNANHYYLQLSLYLYMLEQFGYKYEYAEFQHFELEEVGDEIYKEVNNTTYPVPYMRDTIVKMLQWYSENILSK